MHGAHPNASLTAGSPGAWAWREPRLTRALSVAKRVIDRQNDSVLSGLSTAARFATRRQGEIV